jgi:hypothetical protein
MCPIMTVVPFPVAERAPILEPRDISDVERMISGVAGLLAATGGALALAGRDLYEMSVRERIMILTPMYDAGEVVFGYRAPVTGEIVNVVLEKLRLGAAGASRVCWRAEVWVEEADGHTLRGALAEPTVDALCVRLTRAISGGMAEPLPAPGVALARLLRA